MPTALDLLDQLVSKSLVAVDRAADEPRFRMLEMVRQYAHEKLVDADELQEALAAHFRYFASLAGEALPHMGGAEQRRWLDRLHGELDNLRVALGWLVRAGDPSSSKPFIFAIMSLFLARGYAQEGITWTNALLAKQDASAPLRIDLLLNMSGFAARKGDAALDYECNRQAHALALRLEDEEQIVSTTLILAGSAPDYERGKANLEQAIRLARRAGNRTAVAYGLIFLGQVLTEYGDYDQAAAAFAESEVIMRAAGELNGLSWMLTCAGILAAARGDYEPACAVLEESLSIARQIDNQVFLADAQVELASVALHLGDYARAAANLREALAIYRWVGNAERVAQCLALAARLAHLQGQPERAIYLLAATADAYAHRPIATCLHISFYKAHEQQLAALRAEVDPAVFKRAWAEGRAMSLDQAAEFTLNE